MSFDAWGARRNPALANDVWNQWDLNDHSTWPSWVHAMHDITPRGYTGHEHLDDFGLIHMNGRIYDATLGRFLQADPFMEDTGTLNRYTYVHNNPLVYTDPSGYSSWKKWGRIALSVAVSVWTAGLANAALLASNFSAALGWATLGGALSGFAATGTAEGALWGAFSGAVFFSIGQQFAGTAGKGNGIFGSGYTGPELARASVAHGVAGGTVAELQGGKFGHGFLSAGISKAATPAAMAVSENTYSQAVAVAIVGGTTSEISGGKFANGAVTAAMAFAFNEAVTAEQRRSRAQQLLLGEGETLDNLTPSLIRKRLGLLGDLFLERADVVRDMSGE